MNYACSTFIANTVTGGQSIAGLGFRPKALRIIATLASSDTFGTPSSVSVGITDGTNNRCAFYAINNGVTTTLSAGGANTTDLIHLLANGTPTTDSIATFVSLDSDGFTINWSTAPGTGWKIMFEAWGGNDINVSVGTWNPSASTGSKSLTGLGFRPNMLMWLTSSAASTTGVGLGVGATSGAGQEYGFYISAQSGRVSATPNAYTWHKAASILQGNQSGSSSQEATLTSFDADGWTYNFTTRSNTTNIFYYMAFGGSARWKVGFDTTPGGTGTKQTSGIGFQPTALSFFGQYQVAAATLAAGSAPAQFGGTNAVNTGRCMGCQASNATTQNSSYSIASGVATLAAAAGTSLSLTISLSAWDGDSFTLNTTLNAGSIAREFGYIAMADAPALPLTQPLLFKLVLNQPKLLYNFILNPDTIPTTTGAVYTDTDTPTSITSISSTETVDFVESATVAGVTTPSAVETTDYVESATVSSVTAVTIIETAADVEAATVAGVTSPSITEVAAYVDAATVAGSTSLTYTETTDYVDVATVAGSTSLTYTETTDYVEVATVAGVTSVSIVEIYVAASPTQHPLLMLLAAFHPHFRLPISSQLAPVPPLFITNIDTATVSSVTSVSSVELAAYVDVATVSSVTTPTILETAADIEAATIAGVTTPSITEFANYVEAATISSVTSVSSVDVAVYVDGVTVAGTTTPSITEVGADTEAATVSSVTSVSVVDVAAYVDGTTVVGTTSPSIVEGAAVETATIATVTTVSAIESTDYVEVATVASVTSIVYVELYPTATPTIRPLLMKLGREFKVLTNSPTLSPISQIYVYTETATVTSITTPSATETTDFADAALVSSKTSLTYVELPSNTETPTIATATTVSITEFANYVEAPTVLGTTTISISEFYGKNNVEAATISTKTSVYLVEYQLPLAGYFDLEYQAYRHYEYTAWRRYSIRVSA
jgi:hypothetical protein